VQVIAFSQPQLMFRKGRGKCSNAMLPFPMKEEPKALLKIYCTASGK
jgi:hypothetical protein